MHADFFFFKQKSAYEMRISDWSSDVCSSDLSIRDFGSQGETKNQIAPDRARRSNLDYLALGDWHGALRVDGRTWYAGTPEVDRFQRDDPGQALVVELSTGAEPSVTPIRTGRFHWPLREWMVSDPAEIGRGSCGERVWQWVEL